MPPGTPPGEAGARSPTLRLATRGPLFDGYRALQGRLELAFPTRQFAHVTIPAPPNKAVWDRARAKPPFVGLCWLGLTPAPSTGQRFHCNADWLIYLACANTTPAGLLVGDRYGASLLGLASLGTALLHGWSTPDVGTWSVKSVDNAAIDEFSADDIGVVALQVSCSIALVDVDAAAALPEFLRMGAEWDLPPIGGLALDNVRDAA